MSAHRASEWLLACVCANVTVPVRRPVKGLPAKGARVVRASTHPHLLVVMVVGVGGGVGSRVVMVVVVVLLVVEGVQLG